MQRRPKLISSTKQRRAAKASAAEMRERFLAAESLLMSIRELLQKQSELVRRWDGDGMPDKRG